MELLRTIQWQSQSIRNMPRPTRAVQLLYTKLKQYDKAIADMNRILEIEPGDGNAFYNRGVIHLELKEYDLALADISKAITMNPNNPAYMQVRGGLFVFSLIKLIWQ